MKSWKMFLTIGTLTLTSSLVSANGLKPAFLEAGATKLKLESPGSRNNAIPIRQARVTYKVVHNEVVLVNGSYDFRQTKVCEIAASVNVYDFRGSHEGIVDAKEQTCPVTFQGQPINLKMGAIVSFGDAGGDDLFGQGDLKSAWGYAYPERSLNGFPQIPQGMVITRDLNLRSIMMFMTPHSMIVCESSEVTPAPQPTNKTQNCTVTNPETYAVLVDIED